MGIPDGWHDDGKTLLAPNGVAVVKGFREWILANPWDANDLPLAVERTLPSIEPGNPGIGAGSRSLCLTLAGENKHTQCAFYCAITTQWLQGW